MSESCTLNQIISHLDDYAPLPNYESAYRANHGCETAILELFDDILWCFERKYVCVLCTMDLSAAFDTMDHDLLLTVLKIGLASKQKQINGLKVISDPEV